MSAREYAPGTVAVSTASTTSRLWHRANAENQRLALTGEPWLTLCGERRQRLNGFRQPQADMDVCLVCLEAAGGVA